MPGRDPNVSPKGTLCVLDDAHLIFADLRSPGTVANLRANQNIEVNVVDPFRRKGYRFKGRAVVHEQGAIFEELVAFFTQRKLADAPRRIKAIVVIEVVAAQPLISPAYDEGAMDRRWWLSGGSITLAASHQRSNSAFESGRAEERRAAQRER